MQEKTDNKRPQPITTRAKVEIFTLSVLVTLLCYGITTKCIVPGINFFRYLAIEIMIALSIKLVAYVTKNKR